MKSLFASALVLAHLHFGAHLAAGQTQEEIIEIITDRAEAHGVSPSYLVQVARCESRLYRWAVGAAGEQGLFQLNPRGIGGRFWGMGYDDMGSIWQQADFTARLFAAGFSHHWSCAR